MRPLLPLLGVILVHANGMEGMSQSRNEFPCTKLAEILPDAALDFAKEYFAFRQPTKINVSLLYYSPLTRL